MLYIVATPIGNLEDITLRALRILKEVDIIACEDTRNTKKLLNYYEINNKKLISYHEHNEEKSSDNIINLIKDGKNVALVSDAGLPCISDPGYLLINKCRKKNISVYVVPGANAGLTALVSSGIKSYNYTFYGFLPRKKSELTKKLEEILLQKTTSIIYESPNRIKKVLECIVNRDKNREISIARELTKMYEQVVTCSSEEMLIMLKNGDIREKGEFVLIISPKTEEEQKVDNNNLILEVDTLVKNGYKNSEAIKLISKKYNVNKREVYNLYHNK